jgi:hypothetical protein
MTLGLLLIIVGTMYLLSALGVIGAITAGVFWPVVLIGFGLMLVIGRFRRRRMRWVGWDSDRCW